MIAGHKGCQTCETQPRGGCHPLPPLLRCFPQHLSPAAAGGALRRVAPQGKLVWKPLLQAGERQQRLPRNASPRGNLHFFALKLVAPYGVN